MTDTCESGWQILRVLAKNVIKLLSGWRDTDRPPEQGISTVFDEMEMSATMRRLACNFVGIPGRSVW